MNIAKSILPEFDQEMANTRKMIERLPDDKPDWQPHNKSFSMKKLATHIANLLSWVGITLKQDSLDLSQPFDVPNPQTRDEILELFNKLKIDARNDIENSGDKVFMENWSLKNGDEEVFTMPKIAVLRSFVMNHIIHHRAQLSVYYRLNDIPLPGIYGPTADEQM